MAPPSQAARKYLRKHALFHFARQEQAGHAQQLQAWCRPHSARAQVGVKQVHGQVERVPRQTQVLPGEGRVSTKVQDCYAGLLGPSQLRTCT